MLRAEASDRACRLWLRRPALSVRHQCNGLKATREPINENGLHHEWPSAGGRVRERRRSHLEMSRSAECPRPSRCLERTLARAGRRTARGVGDQAPTSLNGRRTATVFQQLRRLARGVNEVEPNLVPRREGIARSDGVLEARKSTRHRPHAVPAQKVDLALVRSPECRRGTADEDVAILHQ